MQLSRLISYDNTKISDSEIIGITYNYRKVEPGWAFICVAGPNGDGHNDADNAVKNGASVVITERDLGLDNQIIVPDTHITYFDICSKWFGEPLKSLKLIGITGTNGKTSVSYMLKSILEADGKKCGLIGTIQHMIGDEVIPSSNTTPGAYDLNMMFGRMVESGCEYCIMEVSSHALDQRRICGITFDAAVFTNLTQDHLDYHKTMDNYLLAKRKLFLMSKIAILNFDDKASARLVEGIDCEKITYSVESNDATYTAKGINYRADGVDFDFVGFNMLARVKLKTGGKFSVYNGLAAASCAVAFGIPLNTVSMALSELTGVKGRAENVPTGRDFHIIIDYAHTPDGLENIINTFKDVPKTKLTVLFGCGGDRDKTKRPLMGEIASRLADNIIVTSDNPRTENPTEIIRDIVAGIKSKTPYKIIENRIEAIKYAINTAVSGDIIILAGKGHEDYQILNTGKIHLDEREIVKSALEELK